MTMDGDDMRRGNNFFRRNQYKIAAVCILAAVLGVMGMYMLTGREKREDVPKQQTAVKERVENKREEVAKKEEKDKKEEPEKEETRKVSVVIPPKREDVIRKVDADPVIETAQEENQEETKDKEDTVETAKMQNASETELHFDAQAGLMWPLGGSVILDYSMDQTVYFATLDQYKYNPAVIIAGNVNDQVRAAANGKITDISTNEVTGCTVTMDLGDGYTAVYGQLKEVPYEAGAYLEAGNSLGFVSEPTKYYSLEGSNLYFALQKDGVPVDPVEFFQ